jgi:alpha-glucosidase
LYYGEELGMRNAQLRYHELRDPYTKRFWPFRPGRDPARTPMQWDGSPQAGFTTGRPWLPVPHKHSALNVAEEARDPRSLFSLYKRLIGLRRQSPALACGDVSLIETNAVDCLVYQRIAQAGDRAKERMLIVVNFSGRQVEMTLPQSLRPGQLLLSTHPDPVAEPISRQMHLRPDEGRLIRLDD